ncbi:XpsR family transcriptional regulator [Cupriavidus sp. CuC1]|uniref:XpsR family transcriptional regulator n=1 Tax=Cupriavidus sp. CuC1 TaxID=3373131 RepID=UPI0037D0640D
MGKWLNHQRIARIMAAARAQALGIRLDDNDWKEYYWDQLYAPDGAEFKLNLFPLPVMLDGLTPWSKVFRGQSELVPKDRYLDLCRHGGRFRFLRTLCAHWRPKVVICIGYRQAEDFVRAFGLDQVACEERQLQPADQVRLLHAYERDGTTWILCPALAGSAGLTSDVQLNAFGKLLGASLAPSDFDSRPAAASGPGRLPQSQHALSAGSASSALPSGGYPAQRNHHPDPSEARQRRSDFVLQGM